MRSLSAIGHRAFSKSVRLRKKPGWIWAWHTDPFSWKLRALERRPRWGVGRGRLPNSKSLMLQWKTTSSFTLSSTTFQSSIFSRVTRCPSAASTAAKERKGRGGGQAADCHGLPCPHGSQQLVCSPVAQGCNSAILVGTCLALAPECPHLLWKAKP